MSDQMTTTIDSSTTDASDRGTLVLDRVSRSASRGFWSATLHRYFRNKVSVAALIMTVLIVCFVLGAGLISKYVTGFTPSENHLADKLTPPFTNGYILGSDGNGRDVLTRLAYGGRASLLFATLSTLSIVIIGGALGSIAGYFGGIYDNIIMRTVDVLLSLPGLTMLILISALYHPGIFMLSLFVALISWSGISRLVRAEVLRLRHQEFIEAARLSGGSDFRIITRHLLPNVMPIIIVWASLVIPTYILLEATLSYLGLGVRVPTPSWGNMLQDSKQFFRSNWTLVFIPGFMIYITVLSVFLVGSGLRDAVDPRLGDK